MKSPEEIAFRALVTGLGTGIKSATFSMADGRLSHAEAHDLTQHAVASFLADPVQRLALEQMATDIANGNDHRYPVDAMIPPSPQGSGS